MCYQVGSNPAALECAHGEQEALPGHSVAIGTSSSSEANGDGSDDAGRLCGEDKEGTF